MGGNSDITVSFYHITRQEPTKVARLWGDLDPLILYRIGSSSEWFLTPRQTGTLKAFRANSFKESADWLAILRLSACAGSPTFERSSFRRPSMFLCNCGTLVKRMFGGKNKQLQIGQKSYDSKIAVHYFSKILTTNGYLSFRLKK